MSKVSRSLLGMITDKATKSFPGDLLTGCGITSKTDWDENWPLWVKHWFKVAEAQKQAFIEEGLTETAKAVDTIIEDQKRYHQKDLES